MSERVLITSSDPEGLARAVERLIQEPFPWCRLDAPGFDQATIWFCAGAPPESPLSLPKLRWIQSGWAGVETWFTRPEWTEGVDLTRTVGDFPQRIAQHVLGYLLARTLGVDAAFREMAERSWKRWTPGSIAGKNLLVVGMGAIGVEVAAAARAFQMQVVGVTRRGGSGGAHPLDAPETRGLPELLGWADSVVNLLPLRDSRSWTCSAKSRCPPSTPCAAARTSGSRHTWPGSARPKLWRPTSRRIGDASATGSRSGTAWSARAATSVRRDGKALDSTHPSPIIQPMPMVMRRRKIRR